MKKKKQSIIGNKPNYSKEGKIVGIIFLIWFFCSMLAMLILSQINTYYTVMVFGQYFLVFGVIVLLGAGKNKAVVIPFILVGLACIIIPYLMMKPEINGMVIDWGAVIAVLFIFAFVLAGLVLTFIPIIQIKKSKEKWNVEVPAVIVGYDENHGDSSMLYCPIYEFDFNGKKYNVMNNHYSNVGLKEIGTIISLKINPENPEEFLDRRISSFVPMFIGIVFLVIATPLFIVVLKNAEFIIK